MSRAKIRKICVISVCVLLVISVGVLWGYEKHRVKPLFSTLHLSPDDITAAELRYLDGHWVELDPQQVTDLCAVLEGSSLKFWSSSNSGLSNYYASAILYTSSPHPVFEIMFSEDGRVGINDFRSQCLPTYTLVDGGDTLRQYFDKVKPSNRPAK